MQMAKTASLWVSRIWEAIFCPNSTRSSCETSLSGKFGLEDLSSIFRIALCARMGVQFLLVSASYHYALEIFQLPPKFEAPQVRSRTRNVLLFRSRLFENRESHFSSLWKRAGQESRMANV